MINNDNAMLVLNNFNTLLTKSITAYADKHEINAVLCAKGLTLLGCGAHKLVYKYQNAAVGFIKCSLGKRKRMACLLYTSPSPRDCRLSRMPSSA